MRQQKVGSFHSSQFSPLVFIPLCGNMGFSPTKHFVLISNVWNMLPAASTWQPKIPKEMVEWLNCQNRFVVSGHLISQYNKGKIH